jgi:putative hydrolase of the HAD superfamily
VKEKKCYRFFLFDLDRTLWDFDSNVRNNVTSLLELYDLPVGDRDVFFDNYQAINRRLWAEYEKGVLAKEVLKSERFYQTLLKYGIDDRSLSERFGHDYLERMPDQTGLMPHAMEVLTSLRERGAVMALISNGFKEVQYRKLKNSGIDRFFDAILISEEQGVNKPSPIIFKRALKAIKGTKKHAIMVGDDFTNDIEGAMIFGIDQFYYNYRSLPCEGRPTYNSPDLRDLLTLPVPQQGI